MSRVKKISPEDLAGKINSYFLECDAANEGNKLVKPYTLSGLLSELQMTRETFDTLYQDRRYRAVLNGARSKIEAFIEENTLTGRLSATAAANSLKYNFGWGERAEKEEAQKTVVVTLDPTLDELGN